VRYEAALALTLAVEVPLAIALAGPARRWRAASDAPLLNLLTHPLACAAYLRLAAPLPLVEVVVTLVEAAGYRLVTGLSTRRALLVSVLCNATTTLLGVVLARAAA
jgi:hypothetical protein